MNSTSRILAAAAAVLLVAFAFPADGVAQDLAPVSVEDINPDLFPLQVETVDPVEPVQHDPLRPYQNTVHLEPGSSATSAVARFPIPDDFRLVVEHLHVWVTVPSLQSVLGQLFGTFGGQDTHLYLDLNPAPDVSAGFQSFVLSEPIRLYLDDRSVESSLQDFSVAINRSAGSQFWAMEVTVTGYLVPVQTPR